jgi:hypothetical protein
MASLKVVVVHFARFYKIESLPTICLKKMSSPENNAYCFPQNTAPTVRSISYDISTISSELSEKTPFSNPTFFDLSENWYSESF